jgi:DNA-binding CsgD family transcriptional regulator
VEHALIFINVIILLIGSWAAFTLRSRIEQTQEAVLRPIMHHLAFIVAAIFINLVVRYASLNLVGDDFSTARPAWMVLLVLPGFLLETGVAWTLFQTACAFRDRRPSRALERWFLAGVAFFGASIVAGVTIALRGGGVRWLLVSYGAVATTAMLLVVVGLVLMVVGIGPPIDPGKRRDERALGALWLSGWLAFAASAALPGQAGSLASTLSSLWLVVVPLLWVTVVFSGPYGTTLAAAEQSALDSLAATHGITRREQEIVELIVQGKSNKEIEELLFISVHTVKNHVYNIFRKLGVTRRGQLVRLVMEAQARTADGGPRARK